jgi:ankyrin repeat protein
MIYESNPKKIITEGIKKKHFNLNNVYKIILFSQDLEYFDLIDFDINIASNYIQDCVQKCLLRSFYYLFKQDKNIIVFQDSNSNTVLHNITETGSYNDMIKLIITLDPTILFMTNENGETPLIFHIKQKNYLIVETIIKNYSKPELFEQRDNQSNTILHLLCVSNSNIKLIKMFIYDNLQLIDKINNLNETPVLIACKLGAEDIFFLLKSLNVNLTIDDDYGNSVYHYICLNSMVIGSVIVNKPNIFGYTPEDYCNISHKYYAFI